MTSTVFNAGRLALITSLWALACCSSAQAASPAGSQAISPDLSGTYDCTGQDSQEGPYTAVVTLTVDGNIVGSGEIPWMMGTISSVGMSVALDTGSPVSREYAAPFAFEGDLQTMEFQLISRQDAEARKAELAAEMGRQ